jgi:hypothetical protein
VRSLLLSPRWLIRHAVAIVLLVACLRLGWWQWDRARSIGGSAQNLGYALQWPAFGAFVLYAWLRMLRIELHPPAADADQPESSRESTADPGNPPRQTVRVRRRYTPPSTDAALVPPSPDEPSDEQLAAYNAYLAGLNEPSRHQLRRTSP